MAFGNASEFTQSSRLLGVFSGGGRRFQPSLSRKTPLSGLDTFSDMNEGVGVQLDLGDAPGLDPNQFTTDEVVQVSGPTGDGQKTKSSFDLANLTPGQVVGLGAASTGLQMAGAFQNIAEQERAEVNRISQEYDIALDQIEYQEWMTESVRQVTANRRLIQEMNALRQQNVGGGRQVQQFFRNPSTGTPI